MLQLKDIVKDYGSDDNIVHALKGVTLSFRNSEFVAILGPSGCGKTTMLNIIGGLDRYTSGDVLINGKSTTTFKNADWDAYRNNYVGFIFQNYNLINHQTILENVELALTLSGINAKERKARATEALAKVGLADLVHKKPNQLSGGQMQRVAIARALVNNPEIILADEPTGALDSKNSVQIMDLLKEIAKERLVIMVTHNDQLAADYSTRIIKMLDGEVLEDTMAYEPTAEELENLTFFVEEPVPDISGLNDKDSKKVLKAFEKDQNKKKKASVKKTSMNLWTAFKLSLKNLFSKRSRTFLTAFAGSIGIIGIALVLAVNNGFGLYIADMQQTMLGQYPISVQQLYMDMASAMNPMGQNNGNDKLEKFPNTDKITVPSNNMVIGIYSGIHYNRINQNYIDYIEAIDKNIISEISYTYAMSMNLITETGKDGDKKYKKVDFKSADPIIEMMMGSDNRFLEMVSDDFMKANYDVVKGDYPTEPNQIALVVNQYNQLSKSVLSQFHFDDDLDLSNLKYGDFLGREFRVVQYDNWYDSIEIDGVKRYKSPQDSKLEGLYKDIKDDAHKIKVTAVMRVKEGSPMSMYNTSVLYRKELREQIVAENLKSEVVKAQLEEYAKAKADSTYKEKSVFLGENDQVIDVPPFLFDLDGIPGFGEEGKVETPANPFYLDVDERHEVFMQKIGASTMPNNIYVYPKSFENKDSVKAYMDKYNNNKREEDRIQYMDASGMMLDMVKEIIDIVSIVLVCFASISLVVSSIMIGIITYVSVVERTKEIGVLRAIGARKIDIGNVFNAETATIGISSGLMGVIISALLSIPINIIIKHFAKGYVATNIVVLSPVAGIVLILISTLLTLIAGLIPANIAAHKDPVLALRSE